MIGTTIRVAVAAAVVLAVAGGAVWADTATSLPAGTTVKKIESDKPAAPEKAAGGDTTAAPAAGGKATSTSAPARGVQPGPCGDMGDPKVMLLMVGGMIVLFWFMGRGRRKQEAARRAMLANIKKGDRATSIGGIIGTVVDVREDEVVLKVDDNTRIHLARWAVRGVGDDSKAENPDQAKKDK